MLRKALIVATVALAITDRVAGESAARPAV